MSQERKICVMGALDVASLLRQPVPGEEDLCMAAIRSSEPAEKPVPGGGRFVYGGH